MALNVVNFGRVECPRDHLLGWAGGLKAHSAPLFISCNKTSKMPVAGPCLKKLSLKNIFLVTQGKATSTEHRNAYLEIVRVDEIARTKTGERADHAKTFLVSLRNELLAKGDHFIIELTHAYLPESYFMAISPRFMLPPSGPRDGRLATQRKLLGVKRSK